MNRLKERESKLIERLEKEKDGKFKLVGGFTKQREPATFRHIVCGYEWETKPINLLNSKKEEGCPNCQYNNKRNTIDDFEKELLKNHEGRYSITDNTIYFNNRTYLEIEHTECGRVFEVHPTVALRHGGCPYCRKEQGSPRKKSTEEFKKDLYDTHKGEYVLAKNSEYLDAHSKVKVIHTSCGYEWDVRASHILGASGCPKCNESKGEKKISEILRRRGVKFIREFTYLGCANKKELPFDFAIIGKNKEIEFLVEFDGIQHYKPSEHFGGEDKFKSQKKNDSIKDTFCRDRGITLLRIPYYYSDKEMEEEINKLLVEK